MRELVDNEKQACFIINEQLSNGSGFKDSAEEARQGTESQELS